MTGDSGAESALMDSVALVTGSTNGIGRETAFRLAKHGATVLVVGRDEARGRDVIEQIRASHPAADADLFLVDLADQAAVRDFARQVRADYDRLDVLINNAGTWQGERRVTDDGIELTFAVNHLAAFLLTNCLAPLLRESAPARVVTVSSGLHRNADLDLDTVVDRPAYDGRQAYNDSKLANVLFTYELARRLEGSGVAAFAVHPGAIPETSLARDAGGLSKLVWNAFAFLPDVLVGSVFGGVEEGADTLVYAATNSDLDGETGVYVADGERTSSSKAASDEALQATLWELSAELTGLPPDVPAVDPIGTD
ncbi:MAG: NAD(P)-dependent dehydrogenase (short-subunit alcohol dehydrogenase family) [Halobacteriales archaeon]|jgi:NAD(P)-dependent dehydrogenase (short-subunit alcohol dehydrogenase family)